jgi:hypothetical protein
MELKFNKASCPVWGPQKKDTSEVSSALRSPDSRKFGGKLMGLVQDLHSRTAHCHLTSRT